MNNNISYLVKTDKTSTACYRCYCTSILSAWILTVANLAFCNSTAKTNIFYRQRNALTLSNLLRSVPSCYMWKWLFVKFKRSFNSLITCIELFPCVIKVIVFKWHSMATHSWSCCLGVGIITLNLEYLTSFCYLVEGVRLLLFWVED